MADTAAVAAPKVKKAVKPKKPADHPKYAVMISQAIAGLKERGGSSRQAIVKYIQANFKVEKEPTKVNSHVKTALKSGVKSGSLKQAKGTGASGSFKLGEKPKPAKKAAKPKKAAPAKKKKPAAKKPAKKAAGEKKAKAKKATPKKKAPAAKKPAKKAAGEKKPKTAKKATPKKKPAAKKPAAKKPAAKKAAAKK